MIHIEHLQKICDSEDWSDPRVDRIIRDELRLSPSYHRKQWEFALIYLALEAKGKLNPQSRGIAFGAGRERLLFAVANRVGHLLATDLYTPNSQWLGARTNSPKEWLLKSAPFPVDAAKLDATFMDMTDVTHEPNSVDFCYSSCAFEHIGKERETFVKHLSDVAKILKQNGIYTLTTELNYGETIKSPHNFFFRLTDLLEIVAESDLTAEPVFDARLARVRFNWPSIDPGQFGLEILQQPVITPLRFGRIFTSALLVLSKNRERPEVSVLGYDGTYQWLHRQWKSVTLDLWGKWRNIDPYAGMTKAPAGHEQETIPVPRSDGLVVHTAWMHFGTGPVEVNVCVCAPEASPKCLWRVLERASNHVSNRTLKAEMNLGAGLQQMHFTASEDNIYAIEARGALAPEAHVAIHARRSPGQASSWV